MYLSIVFLIIISVFLLVFLYDRYSRTSILTRRIPGPRCWPIIGNSIYFILPLDKLFVFLRTLPKKYGNVSQVHALGARTIGFYDPENIEIILSSIKFSDKDVPYNFMKPWLGEGLLISQGSKWHQRRKLLTQAFHFNILKKYSMTFIEQAEIFMQQVQERIHEKKVDVVPLISSTTLRIMCETAMGTSTEKSIESVASTYSKSIEIFGNAVIERMCRIWLHFDWTFKWSNIAKSQEQAVKNIHSFTNKIIKERRIFLQKNNVNIFEVDEYNDLKGRLALLDLLLENEKSGVIDVNGIREEVDTFMFEFQLHWRPWPVIFYHSQGHDTTATALIFLLMNIANEADVQEKIYEELQSTFGDSQRNPTTEELNEMKYLECCIKESLRLYPSVPIILRYIREETKIGDYIIPKNSNIHISIYDLHRREDIYPEPEKFIPERFLPKNCTKRHPYAYIPFSAGPRNCIGQKFAMLEMKTLVSTLLRRYRLEPVTKPTDLVFKADIVLRTNNKSIFVKFVKRN